MKAALTIAGRQASPSAVYAAEPSSQILLGESVDIVSGCGIDHSNLAGQPSYNQTIPSSGGTRGFLIHVPANYNPNRLTGLIVSYHGAHRNSTNQEELSQFSNATFNENYIAVYPQGVNQTWQGAPYAIQDIDDLQFTQDILTYMRKNFCIDNTQIFASGKSNGGGFVGTIACDAVTGANFAAFAPVSGAFYTDVNWESDCNPKRRPPIPVLEFHGADDDTIPYDEKHARRHGAPLPEIPMWLHRWATRNGCSGEPPSNNTVVPPEYDGLVSHSFWSCGSLRRIVQGYLVQDLGHTWPSTQPNPDNDGDVTVIDATAVIMDFFKSHPKSL